MSAMPKQFSGQLSDEQTTILGGVMLRDLQAREKAGVPFLLDVG